jgi:hypothetical protein
MGCVQWERHNAFPQEPDLRLDLEGLLYHLSPYAPQTEYKFGPVDPSEHNDEQTSAVCNITPIARS